MEKTHLQQLLKPSANLLGFGKNKSCARKDTRTPIARIRLRPCVCVAVCVAVLQGREGWHSRRSPCRGRRRASRRADTGADRRLALVWRALLRAPKEERSGKGKMRKDRFQVKKN
jgi:hypothetical protein